MRPFKIKLNALERPVKILIITQFFFTFSNILRSLIIIPLCPSKNISRTYKEKGEMIYRVKGFSRYQRQSMQWRFFKTYRDFSISETVNKGSLKSSHLHVLKIGTLKNFARFSGKYLCRSLFSDGVAGLWPTSSLKGILRLGCFSMNSTEF